MGSGEKKLAARELVWTCPYFVWVEKVDGYSVL